MQWLWCGKTRVIDCFICLLWVDSEKSVFSYSWKTKKWDNIESIVFSKTPQDGMVDAYFILNMALCCLLLTIAIKFLKTKLLNFHSISVCFYSIIVFRYNVSFFFIVINKQCFLLFHFSLAFCKRCTMQWSNKQCC